MSAEAVRAAVRHSSLVVYFFTSKLPDIGCWACCEEPVVLGVEELVLGAAVLGLAVLGLVVLGLVVLGLVVELPVLPLPEVWA
jgi:hypothetical protein